MPHSTPPRRKTTSPRLENEFEAMRSYWLNIDSMPELESELTPTIGGLETKTDAKKAPKGDKRPPAKGVAKTIAKGGKKSASFK